MTAHTRERRPDAQDGALMIADRRISADDTTASVVASAPTCGRCTMTSTPTDLALPGHELAVQR